MSSSIQAIKALAGASILAVLLFPEPAMAHDASGTAAGFVSGFEHPFLGWIHVLAMIAVGLWGAQLGAPLLWQLPVAFPMMMAVGGFLGLVGLRLPLVEAGMAASAILLGLAIAFEDRPRPVIAMTMVGAFAIFHGYVHGAVLTPSAGAVSFSVGFVVATGLLHMTGIAMGLAHRWPLGRRLIQGMGATIAIAGVVYLWRVVG